MKTPMPAIITEVPAYARLQREMHAALLAQNPQWIGENGQSPQCDDYDRRFAQLLSFCRGFERAHTLAS